MNKSLKERTRAALEAEVLTLCEAGLTYRDIGKRLSITRAVVSGIIYRLDQPSRNKRYVLTLQALLWQFIGQRHPGLTGDVILCAEQALVAENETGKP